MAQRFDFQDAIAGTVFDKGRAADLSNEGAWTSENISLGKFAADLEVVLRALHEEEHGDDPVLLSADAVAVGLTDIYEACWGNGKHEQADDVAGVVRGLVGGAYGENASLQRRLADEIYDFAPKDSPLEVFLVSRYNELAAEAAEVSDPAP